MLINLLGQFSNSEAIASFSGATLFIITQKKLNGVKRLIVFVISFFMGLCGADTATSILIFYFPGHIDIDKNIGAFLASLLAYTIASKLIDFCGRKKFDKS